MSDLNDAYILKRTRGLMDAYCNAERKSVDPVSGLPTWGVEPDEILSALHASMKGLEFMHVMSLSVLLSEFANGDQTTWFDEFSWIQENHQGKVNEMTKVLDELGPIDVCFNDMRVVDGHHRILAHKILGRSRIIVQDAWTKG